MGGCRMSLFSFMFLMQRQRCSAMKAAAGSLSACQGVNACLLYGLQRYIKLGVVQHQYISDLAAVEMTAAVVI